MKAFLAVVLAAVLSVQGVGAAVPGNPQDPTRENDQAVGSAPGAAEQTLAALSGKMHKRRKALGPGGILWGLIWVGSGVAALDAEDGTPLSRYRSVGPTAIGLGAVSLGAGIFALAVKTPAEKAQARVLGIAEDAARELAAANELARLARKGRSGRMIKGGVILALAGVSAALISNEQKGRQYLVAGLLGGWALSKFFVETRAERAFRSYQERIGPKGATPDFVLGFTH